MLQRYWFCKVIFGVEAGPDDNAETVLVHDGQVFSLSPQQRRAVLEAIFSGSSKAVTDQDVVAKKKVKRKKKRSQDEAETEEDEFGDLVEPLPFDAVEIPSVSTAGTDLESEKGGSSSAANVAHALSMTHTSTSKSHSSRVEDDLSDVDGGSVVDDDSETNAVQLDDQTLSPSTPPEKVIDERDALDRIENVSLEGTFEVKEDSTEDRLSQVATSPDKADVFFDRSTDDALQLPVLDDESPPAFSFDGDNLESIDEKNVPYHREASGELTENSPLRLSKLKAVDHSDLPIAEHGVSDKGNLSVPEPMPERTSIFSTSFENGEEECKEEIQDPHDIELAMSAEDSLGDLCDYVPTADPYSFANRQSFAAASVTSEYTFDDDTNDSTNTGENICPICLGGYKQGDMLVVSKNCSHSFHKNCILEWLEKHDDCPNCRVTMVTDSEINKAAPTVVGEQTLTYRTIRTPPSSTSSHSWLAPQANLGSLRNPPPRANAPSTRQSRVTRRPATRASGGNTPTRRENLGMYYQNRDAYD